MASVQRDSGVPALCFNRFESILVENTVRGIEAGIPGFFVRIKVSAVSFTQRNDRRT
jgi:hypothetical protein